CAHADRRDEREELPVGPLAVYRLAVQPPPFAEKEVARVDDLLNLAQRLLVRLPDLPGDEAGQRLLVRLHQAPDLLDRVAPDRRWDGPPCGLGALGDPSALAEHP